MLKSVRKYRIKELQKQPSRGVPREWCSENMQQIYRRTLMLKCDFNKVTKQLCWNHTSVLVISFKFAAYFQNTFIYKHLQMAGSGTNYNNPLQPTMSYEKFRMTCKNT